MWCSTTFPNRRPPLAGGAGGEELGQPGPGEEVPHGGQGSFNNLVCLISKWVPCYPRNYCENLSRLGVVATVKHQCDAC